MFSVLFLKGLSKAVTVLYRLDNRRLFKFTLHRTAAFRPGFTKRGVVLHEEEYQSALCLEFAGSRTISTP